MAKQGVVRRIIWTYIILAVTLYIVLGISFYYITRANIIKQTQERLTQEAEIIANQLSLHRDSRIPESMGRMMPIRMLSRTIQSNYIILGPQGQIIDTNLPRVFEIGTIIQKEYISAALRGQLEKGEIIHIENKNYVLIGVPITEGIKGAVILFTEIEQIAPITFQFIGILTKSMALAIIVTSIVGYFLAIRISRPIKILDSAAQKISQRKFDGEINIKTNDEIEDLANSINLMSKRLKEHNESQKQFLQNISHEIKTPLMSIQGYVEGILDGVFTGNEVDDSLKVVVKETERLKGLVNEIIYLTKIEETEKYNFTSFSLKEVLKDAVEAARGLIKGKDFSIDIQCGNDFRIYADKDKIYRGFFNIISNGIIFGRSKLTITIEKNNEGLILTFTDDGPGFKKGEKEKIFNRFYKGNMGSTGLGLTITRTIIEGHQGKIWAENNINNGSGGIIRVFLPAK